MILIMLCITRLAKAADAEGLLHSRAVVGLAKKVSKGFYSEYFQPSENEIEITRLLGAGDIGREKRAKIVIFPAKVHYTLISFASENSRFPLTTPDNIKIKQTFHQYSCMENRKIY